MSRENIKWFGFNLTQKQAVNIFILSLIGVIFSAFFMLMMLYPIIMTFTYYDPYDPYFYPDNYIIMMLLNMLAPLVLFLVIFLISLYSLNRCRKIAKYYSPLVDPVIEPKPIPRYTEVKRHDVAQFCPNCGNVRQSHQKFCVNCGYQIN
jgi:hypothetical protein